jgi:hypothetical protein
MNTSGVRTSGIRVVELMGNGLALGGAMTGMSLS